MEEKIKKDIRNLAKLQEAEHEIIRLDKVLSEFDQEKKKIGVELIDFEGLLNKDKDEFMAIEASCKEYENEIQLVLDRIQKSNENLRMVKTNKEYQALRRELDDNTKRKLSLEDELFYQTEKKEEIQNKLEERKKDFSQLTEKINSEKMEIDKRSKDDLGSLEKFKNKKKKLGKTLDPRIFDQFKTIAKMNNGEAVAQGKNEVCMGCFMNIPPQLFIELQRGNKLIKCPQCSRFLYYKEESN
ncbi:MAG: nucleotide-binding protein [Desulfobacteraceae bacterium]|nr:nucleotide-binding protein [Desulfobacteraceae bacterium]